MRSAATACTSRSRRMIRSSPCTSTSCWSSGEKSPWSPPFTWRTDPPTPRASPQTSRLATWAVAGIRMPPVDRRSPSSLRSATRIRSCSILIGSLPAGEGTMFSDTSINATRRRGAGTARSRGRRERASERWGGAGPSSSPAELVQAVVVDAEVVRDLVDDGDRDLLDDLVLGLADVTDRQPVDHDPVGQRPAVLPAALGQRVALVQPEQVRLVGVAVLDEDDDVVQERHELGRHLVEGVGDQLLELLRWEWLHRRTFTSWSAADGPPRSRPSSAPPGPPAP